MSRIDTAEAVAPHAGLLRWLHDHAVEFEVREHPLTFTARETAQAEGIDPIRFAKVVAVEMIDGGRALLVVDAADQVDLRKAGGVLGGPVRLLRESDLLELAPDCAAGTIPPVGELFGVQVLADRAIHDDPVITFHAGSHRHTVTVDEASWERAAGVVLADLAADRERVPAWARS
jgi:Ala-tRNA(Pro) deacylase